MTPPRPADEVAPVLALVLALLSCGGCGRELGAELEHQPPVIALEGPSSAVRNKAVTFTTRVTLRDAALRELVFEVYSGVADRTHRAVIKGPRVRYTFTQPGLYYVSATAVDERHASGRATLPVQVERSPADDRDPPTATLSVTRGGKPLADGAGLSFGDALALSLAASDGETPIGKVALSLQDAKGSSVPLDSSAGCKPPGAKSVTCSYKAVAPAVAGSLTVEASVADTAVPPNKVRTGKLTYKVSAKDSDGDGLPDSAETGGCADPKVFNGLALGVWPLSPFPGALCWLAARPAGEAIHSLVSTSTPAYKAKVTTGFLDLTGSGAIGAVVPGLAGAPTAAGGLKESFALLYSGSLCVPSGAATLALEAESADDVLVLLVDGKAVASNDIGMGCTTYYDWDKMQYVKDKASVDVSGSSEVKLGVLVANKSGSYAWKVKLAFADSGGAALPVTLDQRMFQAE